MKKPMIIAELEKNLKLIFRNKTSLLLLVLGPLLIITIIGLTFSGSELHDVVIGVHSENITLPPEVVSTVERIGVLLEYDELGDCIVGIREGRIHICMSVTSAGFDDRQTLLLFHHDPAQKKLGSLILSTLNEDFSSHSSSVSVSTTKEILSQLQIFTSYVVSTADGMNNTIAELEEAQVLLLQRGEELSSLNRSFTPRYTELKESQKTFNEAVVLVLKYKDSSLVNESIINGVVGSLGRSLRSINNTIINGSSFPSIPNVSLGNNSPTVFFDSLVLVNTTVSKAIGDIDILKVSLDRELVYNDLALERANSTITTLKSIKGDIDEQLLPLSKVTPELAEFLINPVLQEFQGTNDLNAVQSAFSGLLVMIIVFISLLFSTILTVTEINNEAFFRNLIAPRRRMLYPVGLLLTNTILVSIQLGVLLLVGRYLLGVNTFSYIPSVMLIIGLLIVLFTIIGMSIAFFLKTSQTAVLTTTFIALGTYLFSNLLTPLEIMPKTVSTIASLNPIVGAERMLRLSFTYSTPIITQQKELLILVLGVLIASIICTIAFAHFLSQKKK